MKRVLVAALTPCLAAVALSTAAAQAGPVLAQEPVVSATHVVFVFAGDLWSVPRSGRRGEATDDRRPASSRTRRSRPDGELDRLHRPVRRQRRRLRGAVAGRRAAAADVAPRPRHGARLDRDGKRVLFSSPRTSYSRFRELFLRRPRRRTRREAAAADGLRGRVLAGRRAARLRAAVACVRRLEALPRRPGDADLDRRRLPTASVEKIPRETSNDFSPIVGRRQGLLPERSRPSR